MSAAKQILNAFPGKDEPHRSVRMALLAVLYGAQRIEQDLADVHERLVTAIEDPPFSVWWGPDEIRQLAKSLRALAGALETSVVALASAQHEWDRFDSPEREPVYWKRDSHSEGTAADVDVRQSDAEGADTPF